MNTDKIVELATSHIRIDGGTQSRAILNDEVVAEYSEKMQAGKKFKPCVVFYDGSNNWLADGFHRYHAAAIANKPLRCEQRTGMRRDAFRYCLGANAEHGLRRNNEDKRNVVNLALADAETAAFSNPVIAEICAVSAELVRQIRAEQPPTVGGSSDTRIGKDGKEYPAHIAPPAPPQAPPIAPPAPQNFAADNAQNDDIGSDESAEQGRVEQGSTPPVEGQFVETTVETINADLPEEPREPGKLTQAEEDAMTESEWLETLPLLHKLRAENFPTVSFVAAASNWRKLRPNMEALRRQVNNTIQEFHNDDFSNRVRLSCCTPHPRNWTFSRGSNGGFLL